MFTVDEAHRPRHRSTAQTPVHPRGDGPPTYEESVMNKASIAPIWDMIRLRHGIGLRCIQALPADQLDAHPIRDMRTPKELVVHMYSFMRAAATSVITGTLAWDEKAELSNIKTRDDLAAY